MTDFVVQGQAVPEELTGPFSDSTAHVSDGAKLQCRLDHDGYVFLRDVLDKEEVMAARAEVFGRLAEVGEIKQPAVEGIATGDSRRRELVDDLGMFWQSVSEGPALRRVSHGPRVLELVQTIYGEPARGHDYMWLRPWPIGRSTPLHYDHPFFIRGLDRLYTVWIPLGDIAVTDGPLVIVEGSHTFSDLIEAMRNDDDESNNTPDVAQRAAYQPEATQDAIEFIKSRKTRLLSNEFHTGDLIVFSKITMHGSLDNRSAIGRTRLSCDVRYQPAVAPTDERYFGANPEGAKRGGYGEMKAAKPLNEPW